MMIIIHLKNLIVIDIYQEKLYIFYLCDIGHKYNSENCINLESYSGKMNS